MMHAYDEIYLDKARTAMGRMLDFAVYDLDYKLSDFWKFFLASGVCAKFEIGDASLIAGKSGVEIVYEILPENTERISPKYTANRSEEYWTGWVLSYYQWETGLTFKRITDTADIDEICLMYMPYHEMDIRQFCDRMNELYRQRNPDTNLKRLRKSAGYTQAELAKITGIPVRTIQQYEQGQKNINKAQAEYVIRLSKVLYCKPEELLEKV
jgi:DNA-binding XRE family transcriptional regulator